MKIRKALNYENATTRNYENMKMRRILNYENMKTRICENMTNAKNTKL